MRASDLREQYQAHHLDSSLHLDLSSEIGCRYCQMVLDPPCKWCLGQAGYHSGNMLELLSQCTEMVQRGLCAGFKISIVLH